MLFFDILAILTLLYWMGMLVDSMIGLRWIKEIKADRAIDQNLLQKLPFISVVIAARNEEKDIQTTLRQVLAQDYPAFEVIVVNDRSTDQTAKRLQEIKKWWDAPFPDPDASPALKTTGRQRPHLTIIEVTELPDGWLGKNHALYHGALMSKGDYILFTDADVRFDRSVLKSSVACALEEKVDLLTLSPQMVTNRFVLRLFVHYFLFSFTLFKRLWVANNDKQHKYGVGIGAFNLIKKSVYEAIGTHRSIAMRPDDDLQLGMKVKQKGYRQRVYTAKSMLQVEWYPTLREAVRGLEKNAFAGLHYSYAFAFYALFGQVFVFLFPFIAVFIWQGWKLVCYGLSIAFIVSLYLLLVRKMTTESGLNVLLLPISVLLFCYVFVRAILLTFYKGGIEWRGTFYKLSELRRKQGSNQD